MKCSECITEGKKSQVNPGWSTVTAMYCAPYYDEDGKYHNHDRNTTTTETSNQVEGQGAQSKTGGSRSKDQAHGRCRVYPDTGIQRSVEKKRPVRQGD